MLLLLLSKLLSSLRSCRCLLATVAVLTCASWSRTPHHFPPPKDKWGEGIAERGCGGLFRQAAAPKRSEGMHAGERRRFREGSEKVPRRFREGSEGMHAGEKARAAAAMA